MKNESYGIICHSAKQREMIYDLIFAAGLPWQKGYANTSKIFTGDDIERRFPFKQDSWSSIILQTSGYVALGSNTEHKLDATTDFIAILELISKIATDHKNEFKPVEVPLNDSYTATIVDKTGKVKVGCQEFEASIVLKLANEIKKIINK